MGALYLWECPRYHPVVRVIWLRLARSAGPHIVTWKEQRADKRVGVEGRDMGRKGIERGRKTELK